jgi:hypothetical protein
MNFLKSELRKNSIKLDTGFELQYQRENSVYSKSLIAPWLAADIIGGAASGLINIFEQGASSGFSESIDTSSVGWAMLKGAVTSSAAPWSRIARLF